MLSLCSILLQPKMYQNNELPSQGRSCVNKRNNSISNESFPLFDENQTSDHPTVTNFPNLINNFHVPIKTSPKYDGMKHEKSIYHSVQFKYQTTIYSNIL